GLDFEFRIGSPSNHGIANESNRHMRVAKKANTRVLISKTGCSSQFVEDVTPALRPVQSGVNDGKTGHQTDVTQLAQPLSVVHCQLIAGPIDCFSSVRIKSFKVGFAGAILVVVAFDTGHSHLANG